jgi:hypothetical protein
VRALLAAAAFGTAATLLPGLATAQGTADCARELFYTESRLKIALADLEKAESQTLASRCATWRTHLETMRRAGALYARCLGGPEREERVATMKEQVTGFEDRLRRCPRP